MTTPIPFPTTNVPIRQHLRLRAGLGTKTRVTVLCLALFMGVGALFGGYGLLNDAEGLGVKASWLDGSPFRDYTVPGLFLLVVIGGGMLGTAVLVGLEDLWAPLVAAGMGTVLLFWLVVETLTIGYQGGPQLALLAICGGAGLALAGSGAVAVIRANRVGGNAETEESPASG